jgi:hypothetical protein
VQGPEQVGESVCSPSGNPRVVDFLAQLPFLHKRVREKVHGSLADLSRLPLPAPLCSCAGAQDRVTSGLRLQN